MASDKIVRRIAVTKVDPETDIIGLIDLIEFELGTGADKTSLRGQLEAAVEEIQRRAGAASPENIAAISDVAERLAHIERLLIDAGFERPTG